jgi:hypothetical protein
VFSTSEMGAAIAAYIRYVLDGHKAVVLFADNGYGKPMSEGFAASARQLGIDATLRAIGDNPVALAEEPAASPDRAPIVLAMTDDGAAPLFMAMRRHGIASPVFGSSAQGLP